MVLKDQMNKKAHEESAQIACEAAGAIRTVASLAREDDCFKVYSRSLEDPLRHASRSALWSSMLFAASQSVTFVCLYDLIESSISQAIQIFRYLLGLLVWLASRVHFRIYYFPVFCWTNGMHL